MGQDQTGPSQSAKSFLGVSYTAKIKLHMFCLILDLLFKLQLTLGKLIASVNDITEKWAPRGAIDQLG
jgi:hypothetical protein